MSATSRREIFTTGHYCETGCHGGPGADWVVGCNRGEAALRELLISTKQDHTGVLVAVHDSGPGIHSDHLERVFKSFYTTKPRGTGMGLSICQSIIDAHGGRLWVEANRPRGTVFQFTLPTVP